jgi:sulfite exporter TauE/SafE
VVAIAAIIALWRFGSLTQFDLPLANLPQHADYGLVFLIGIFASFHCIGMCGGIVLSYLVSKAQAGHYPYMGHLLYGFGKTVSYMLFGALFGAIGGAIRFDLTLRSIASTVAGLFLVVYGLGMLDGLRWLRRFQIRISRFVAQKTAQLRSHTNNPLTIGLLNGLMIACGSLQTLYVLAASTGSALEGALLPGFFGLGTVPAMIAFAYLSTVVSTQLARKFL